MGIYEVEMQMSSRVKKAQLQALRREFEVLSMKEEETVVEKIFRSTPVRFNYVLCLIEYSRHISTMTVDELESSLIVQQHRMKKFQKEEEQALKVFSNDREPRRGRGIDYGRGARGRGRQSLNKEHIECYRCGKMVHYRNECPSNEGNTNYAEAEKEEVILLMDDCEDQDHTKEETWYLDSECSNHISGNKEWFFDLDEGFKESVKLGDGRRIEVQGKGNVKVRVNGRVQVITSVFYISKLKNNLLSIGQLQHKGLTVTFKNDMCNVYHEKWGLVISSKMARNKLFDVNVVPVLPACLKTATEDTTKLWHQRYAHLSVKRLRTLNQRNMVKGLPEVNDLEEVCIDCAVGKQYRESIPKVSNWWASKKLELIHADICGPIKP